MERFPFGIIVSFESSTKPGHWVVQAGFVMHADACIYAEELSRKLPSLLLRVEADSGSYVNVYFQGGKETVNVPVEMAA